MKWANGADEPQTPELAELYAAVEKFRRRPGKDQPQESLPYQLADLRHIQDLLELEFSEMTANFSLEQAEELGSTSPYDWIRHNCRMNGSAAMDRLNVGGQLQKLASTKAAVEEGDVGFAHLSVITRAKMLVENSSTAVAEFDEEVLLQRAYDSSPGKLWYFCEKARNAADREGVALEQRRLVEERSLQLTATEYGLALRGWVDHVGGAAIRSALEPLSQPSGAHDERRRETRLADALIELSLHALDAGVLPSHGGQRPHVQVTTTLEGLLEALGAEGADVQYSKRPISYKSLEHLTCDSTVSRVLVNPESVVVDLGRATRVVSGAQRRALNARDGACRWPGCDREASWTAAHHLKHWAKDLGETNLENLLLLCHRHHTMVHEGCWQLVPTDEGLKPIPPRLNYYGYTDPSRAPDDFEAA